MILTRGGQDNEVSGGMWETVETSARKIGVEEAKEGRSEKGSRKRKRGKGKEEETEKGENSGGKESSRRV